MGSAKRFVLTKLVVSSARKCLHARCNFVGPTHWTTNAETNTCTVIQQILWLSRHICTPQTTPGSQWRVVWIE